MSPDEFVREYEQLLAELELRYFNKVLRNKRRFIEAVAAQVLLTGTPQLPKPEVAAEALAAELQAAREQVYQSFDRFGPLSKRQIGLGIDVEGRRLRYLAGQYFAQHGLARTRLQHQTTINDLKTVIAQGIDEGQASAEIARQIVKSGVDVTRQRAGAIARTETHGAIMRVHNDVGQQAQLAGFRVKKEWVSATDERVRISHQIANGQAVDQDEYFVVNGERLMHPGDPEGSAANVINCRCTIIHRVV